MVDFSHLSQLSEDGTKALPYTFEEIAGGPTLTSRPATTANTRYNSARLRGISKRTGGGRKRIRIDQNTIDAARQDDIELIAKYCVTGWTVPPRDRSGEEVPFSSENCEAFFRAMPDWMFDDFRTWAQDPLSFVDDPDGASDEEELEELGNCTAGTSNGSSDLSGTGTA